MTVASSTPALHPNSLSAVLAGNALLALAWSPASGEDTQNIETGRKLVMKLIQSFRSGEAPSATPDVQPFALPAGVNQVYDALQILRSAEALWNEEDGTRPTQAVITAAERILPFVPPSMAKPKIGFGGDGDLYFCWESAYGVAFLSIAETELHLLLKPTGKPSVYRDSLLHDQTLLSNYILPAIRPFAAAIGAST